MTFSLNFRRLLPSRFYSLRLYDSRRRAFHIRQRCSQTGHSLVIVRRVFNKVSFGEAPARGPTPYPFNIPFLREKVPFQVYLHLTNGTPYIPTLEIPTPLDEKKGAGALIRTFTWAFTVLFIVCLFRILSTLLSRFVDSKPFPSRKQNIMNINNFCKKIKSGKNNRMNSRKNGSHFPWKTRAELQHRTDPNVLKYDNYAKAKLT